MKNKSMVSSLRASIGWVLAGNFGAKAFEFAFGVVLARLLVPADFGMIVTVQIFTGIAGLVAGGGLGQALVQAKDLKEKDYSVVFSWQLIIGVVIFSFFYLIAPYFAVWFEDPLYEQLLQVSAITFLMRPFINTPQSKLQREMRFKEITYINLATLITVGVISVAMALSDYGVWSLVISGLCGGVVNAILLYWRTRLRTVIYFEKETAKRLGGFGVRLSGCNILTYIYERVANLIISKSMGASALGLFNKADSLGRLPMQMIGGSAHLPVFRAAAEAQDNLDKVRYIYYRTLCLVSVYTLPFYVGLWWTAESFILTVYGDQWGFAVAPLVIFALAGPLRCILNPSTAVTRGMGRVGAEFRILLVVIAVLVAACLYAIEWGIIGIAWAAVVTMVVHLLLQGILTLRTIKGRAIDVARQMLPAFILNLTLFLALLLTDYLLGMSDISSASWQYLLIMAPVGGAVYALAFLFMPIKALASESEKWRNKLAAVVLKKSGAS